MIEWIKAFGVGVAFGIVVTLLRLPLPAPPVMSGVLGIVGVYVGYRIVETFFR